MSSLAVLTTYKYKVVGLNLENLLFSLTSSGIALKNIKKRAKSLTFECNSQNDKLIRECTQNLGLSIRVISTNGLGKFIKSLPYRIGTILGIVYSIFCVCYFTNVVNKVDYVWEENHICTNGDQCIFRQENLDKIKTEIGKNIIVGEKINSNIKDIQNQIMANFELVETCIISKVGNCVTINLYEAVAKDVNNPKQIIAHQNCIIKSITTYSGKAMVKAGDVVKKGQVLVDCDGDVLPRASITAKVWYIGTAIHNCNQSMLVETGNTFVSSSIDFANFNLLKSEQCSYKYYKEQTSTVQISSTIIPITKTTHIYSELEIQDVYVPWEDVKFTVIAQSKQNALDKTNGSAIEVTYSIVSQNDVYKVDCYLLCEEQIC